MASPKLELPGALQPPFPDFPFAELQLSDQIEHLGGEPRLGILRLLQLASRIGPAACVRNRPIPGCRVGVAGPVAVREQRALEVDEQVGDSTVLPGQPEGEVDLAAVAEDRSGRTRINLKLGRR
ncbi:MAG: hypothetical protein OXN84_06660 [Albidovulum sp.]|nr:hypothetical protein [Albidovulum sp.]